MKIQRNGKSLNNPQNISAYEQAMFQNGCLVLYRLYSLEDKKVQISYDLVVPLIYFQYNYCFYK